MCYYTITAAIVLSIHTNKSMLNQNQKFKEFKFCLNFKHGGGCGGHGGIGGGWVVVWGGGGHDGGAVVVVG